MKLILAAAVLLTLASAAFANSYRVTYTNSYRVTYTNRGLIQRITVQAESVHEARRTVQYLFPGCYVTGAYKAGK